MEIRKSELKVAFIRRINLINIILILLSGLFPSCKNKPKEKSDQELRQQAVKICENNIIIDSHIDWPEWILAYPEDISAKTQKGDFDLERANKGGLNAALSVIYINSDYNVNEGRKMVDSMLNLITYYPKTYPDKFAQARSVADVKKNFSRSLFSLPICLENGVGPTQPTDVQDVSGYPVIVCELLKRGYSEKDIKKILSGNFFRVWNEVIKIADTLSKSSGPASPVASNDKEEGRTLNRRVELVKQ